MKKATDLQMLMIAAIRADDSVGRGSDSAIDDYDDKQLLELLNRQEVTDCARAVAVARLEQQRHECAETNWGMT